MNARTAAGQAAVMGDTLPAAAVTLRLRWSGAHPGDYLRLVVNGRAYHDLLVGEAGEVAWPLAAGQARWCTAELRDGEDGLWAVTNPIYFTM